MQQAWLRRAQGMRWLAVAAGLVAHDAAASSLRYFGTQLNDVDRVKIRIDDPTTSTELPRPIDVGATDFTIEFWLKTAAGNNAAAMTCGPNHDWVYGNIVIDRNRYSQGREWGIVLANGRLVFGVSNDNRSQEATICGTSDLRDGQWHHVAIQRQRSNGALWVFIDGDLEGQQSSGPTGDVSYPDNGVPVSVSDCGGPCTNSDPFFVIGAEKHSIVGANAFFGWVDELRVSTVLRYASDFTPPAQPFTVDADTAALYHFDEGTGTSAFDATGNANQTGQLRIGGSQSGPQWSAETPFSGAPAPGTLRFSSATYSRSETGGGTATITVSRAGGSSGAATVAYATQDGTATAGADYAMTVGTLSWASGDSAPQTFMVTVNDDATDESDETVQLSLTNATGAALGSPSTATLTIVDDDTVPVPGALSFSVSSLSRSESQTTATLTVNRTGGTSGAVGVSYTTVSGTATAGSDYTTTAGTLSWGDGVSTARTITVPLLPDTDDEPNEQFTVVLSAPTGGATLGAITTVTVTINDDDATPVPGTLAFASDSVAVIENQPSVQLTVNRTAGSSGAVSINYATAAGSASAGGDFVATMGSLTFNDGVTSQTLTIPLVNDVASESNEQFTVTLSAPTGGAMLGVPAAVTITINDDDAAPAPGSLSFAVAAFSVSESQPSVTLTVNRTGGTSGAVGVIYATASGTATAGSDYQTTSGTLPFAAGASTGTITVPLVNDTTNESSEQFRVTLSMPTGGAMLGATITVTVTITDDDAAPTPGSLSFATAAVTIGENQPSVTLSVNRTGGTSGAVGVTFATVAGSAVAGGDYQTTNGTLSFAAGVGTATIVVPLVNDATSESSEQFTVTLSAPTGGATLTNPVTATVTITDDDTVSPPPAADPGGGGGAVGGWWCLGLAGLAVLRRRRRGA